MVQTCGRGLSVFGGGKLGFAGAAMLPVVAFAPDFPPIAYQYLAKVVNEYQDDTGLDLPDPLAEVAKF